jgi:hypothetical protein
MRKVDCVWENHNAVSIKTGRHQAVPREDIQSNHNGNVVFEETEFSCD